MFLLEVSYFFNKVKDVKASDLASAFKLAAALIAKPFFKKKYRDWWLVCEEPGEARDNGYWFFRYLCREQTVPCCYAIKRGCADYHKVAGLGEVVEHGSLKHWIIFLTCRYNISSQKGGKPNAALCSFLELNGLLHVNNVFLQHGVTINNARWLYADRARFSTFITATRPETDYIKANFGYPEGVVRYTGFPRFDGLHAFQVKPDRILIMPSWRAWFRERSQRLDESDGDFLRSDYLKYWSEVLSSPRLAELIRSRGLEVIFYPHRNMQPYLDSFRRVDTPVVIASAAEYDVQELLKSSEMLVTDYSSVFFDMVYMKKPVIFFQFDEEKFRRQQYREGYFDYHDTAFGSFCTTADQVVDALTGYVDARYAVSGAYLREHAATFELYDDKNCERVFETIVAPRTDS